MVVFCDIFKVHDTSQLPRVTGCPLCHHSGTNLPELHPANLSEMGPRLGQMDRCYTKLTSLRLSLSVLRLTSTAYRTSQLLIAAEYAGPPDPLKPG